MSDLETIVRQFVVQIREVVKQELLQAFLAGERTPVKRKPGRPPGSKAALAPKRKKGQKRDPKEILGLTTQLGAAIKAGPGHRIEQLAKMLEVSAKDLALPVKKLIADGKIKTTGQRRATKYFPK